MFDVLVTGGAGYVGSHTCVALLDAGYSVVVVDDLSNSRFEVISRIREVTGKKLCFYPYDVTDEIEMEKIFSRHNINCVLHFAGKKSVAESVIMPLDYYRTNLLSAISLTRVMQRHSIKKLVFSSSATVYGEKARIPFSEKRPAGQCVNPYGRSKWMVEQILSDIYQADSDWSIVILRYFNPVGAHPSGLLGEDGHGKPNNLFPYITRVASGALDFLPVYGADYPTKDGTGVRDYVHIMDLAAGHVAAFNKVCDAKGVCTYNLGAGKGYSVLDVIHTFEEVVGRAVPHRLLPRREGDVAVSYASTKKASDELNWKATRELKDMCEDAWRWQQMNPNGY